MHTLISFLNIPMPMPLWFCVAVFCAMAWSLIVFRKHRHTIAELHRERGKLEEQIQIQKEIAVGEALKRGRAIAEMRAAIAKARRDGDEQ